MTNEDIRSRRCVFVSHCMLAQAIRASGLAKKYAASVKPIIQFCLNNDINIMQMPCPESICASGGIGRTPHGKAWYEKRGLRETSRKIALGQFEYIKTLVENSYEILAIIGIEFSPACAVTYLNRGPVIYKDEGIYIEELKTLLEDAGIEIPFMGVNVRAHRKMERDMESLLQRAEEKASVGISAQRELF